MKKVILILAIIFSITFQSNVVNASSRIKDIVNFEGIRDNVLVGYGLIVGLNGSGDNLRNSAFTQKGLVDFLERLGVNTRGTNLRTRNIAAVMVTATLPAFARAGSRINVTLSTLGDARSIKGGTLIATPLLGADGEVYAVAQGAVSIGTLANNEAEGTKTIPTSGYISGGAIIEREVDFALNSLDTVNIALKNADISTARSIAIAINSHIGQDIAKANDPGTVELIVPEEYHNNTLGLLADIENLRVTPDAIAKIVIDEASGTIVIGENVKINTVAIAQGNLSIQVDSEQSFIQKLTGHEPNNEDKNMGILPKNTTLKDLVKGLNSLGVTPRDLVSILKTLKQAGALQAEIEVR